MIKTIVTKSKNYLAKLPQQGQSNHMIVINAVPRYTNIIPRATNNTKTMNVHYIILFYNFYGF